MFMRLRLLLCKQKTICKVFKQGSDIINVCGILGRFGDSQVQNELN